MKMPKKLCDAQDPEEFAECISNVMTGKSDRDALQALGQIYAYRQTKVDRDNANLTRDVKKIKIALYHEQYGIVNMRDWICSALEAGVSSAKVFVKAVAAIIAVLTLISVIFPKVTIAIDTIHPLTLILIFLLVCAIGSIVFISGFIESQFRKDKKVYQEDQEGDE